MALENAQESHLKYCRHIITGLFISILQDHAIKSLPSNVTREAS